MVRSSVHTFRRKVWRYYRRYRRDFPWRGTRDPYKILVSEVMLQQTQADRVIPYYRTFLKRFPTIQSLARAPLTKVLGVWQGLGYNRRALNFKKLAAMVVEKYGGKLPSDSQELQKLPGIGPATAGAVAAFAFGKPVVFIETNIRRAFIHEFFSGHGRLRSATARQAKVSDRKILLLIEQTADKKNPREWYYALMDYGAHLAKTAENPNRRSVNYVKQSPFEGSNRQLRGKILTLLLQNRSLSIQALTRKLARPKAQVAKLLSELATEGFIRKENNKFVFST